MLHVHLELDRRGPKTRKIRASRRLREYLAPVMIAGQYPRQAMGLRRDFDILVEEMVFKPSKSEFYGVGYKMHPGAFVRRLFGPYERQISDAYRSIYVDLDALVAQIRIWQPAARRILEVGCGEGAVTQRLRAAYTAADITAIDVSPRVGRLYRGSRENVSFSQSSIEEIAAAGAGTHDLVVLCDVLHHVPPASRAGLLDGIRAALAPRGTFVFKDWERNRAPIHWLCHASDRWITGDRVQFLTRGQMREDLCRRFGTGAVVAEAWVRPWRNNVAFLVRPSTGCDVGPNLERPETTAMSGISDPRCPPGPAEAPGDAARASRLRD